LEAERSDQCRRAGVGVGVNPGERQTVACCEVDQPLGIRRVAGADDLNAGADLEKRLSPPEQGLQQELAEIPMGVDQGSDAVSRDPQDGACRDDDGGDQHPLAGQQVQLGDEVAPSKDGYGPSLSIMDVEGLDRSLEHDD
jgi:hypothetical protein